MMRQALLEGHKGLGLTAPNPSVGAIIVRDQKIIARGHHQAAGKPHAEKQALQDCHNQNHSPQGTDLYLTLEPCSTTGRTPPCTQAIIENGFRRVIWAADDPNPAHQGNARQILTSAGIQVQTGILAHEAEILHRGFFKVQRQGLPWIIVKTALSLDGRITRPPHETQWLTSKEALTDVQTIRGQVDAILTSGQTARTDNPRLTYRGPRTQKKQPHRLIFTNQPQAGLPKEAHLLQTTQPTRFIKGDLKENLQKLAQEGIQTILVEAGGQLISQLLAQNLVDEWISYLAPIITGGPNPALSGTGAQNLSQRPRLTNISYQQLGPDIRLQGYLKKQP